MDFLVTLKCTQSLGFVPYQFPNLSLLLCFHKLEPKNQHQMSGVSEDCKKPCLLVDLVYVLEGVTWFSFWLAKNVKDISLQRSGA